MHAALDRVLDKDATPDLVPPGALVLQPNDERRRSGSHYTPRELTEPIVRHALAPIFTRLRGEDGGAPTPAEILDLKVCDPAMGSGAFLVETCRQLADALIEAWGAHGEMPVIPPDEDEVIHARRLVAQRCLYGIDRNPMAVDLAKTSLWLSTLARDHPLTFVDHAFRHGDSLVGLTRRQIEAFHWLPDTEPFQAGFEVMRVREHVAKAAELRRRIREAGDEVSDRDLHALWHDARNEIDEVQLYGDLALAAFFAEAKPKQREARRLQFTTAVAEGEAIRYLPWLEEQRDATPALAPFHWEIEFPEVFDRENPGFDAFVGNPPFLGGTKISSSSGKTYLDWLLGQHDESHGNADIVAHFFRRSFNLVRDTGTLGLIATNTIAQGDTRSSSLRWICTHGGEIYRATTRFSWPGDAAVVVSVLHIQRGEYSGEKWLDGRDVKEITAFLFHQSGHEDPFHLAENHGFSYTGAKIYGQGFTFDDTDKKDVATPLDEMRRLIDVNPRNREVIFPYIGGEEVNTSPTHTHHRFVVNFADFPLRREDLEIQWVVADEDQRHEWLQRGIVPIDYPHPVAGDWPELMAIVEANVKPERMKLRDTSDGRRLKATWWQFGRARPELQAAIAGLERVLVNSQVSANIQFVFLPSRMVFAHTANVFPFFTYSAFCVLQSRPHESWARFFGSSMKDDPRYTPSDCFDTFPFPGVWEACPALEAAGQAYYEHRAALMVRNNEGMTKTYNRFHDPYDDDPEIAELRELHAAMDRAVLAAYGWTDIPTDCEFLLDYEIDEATWGRKKKPYRYRWPDPVRDEVLARLLALNTERAAEETRSGVPSPTSPQAPTPQPGRKRYRQAQIPRPTLKVAEPKPLRPSHDD